MTTAVEDARDLAERRDSARMTICETVGLIRDAVEQINEALQTLGALQDEAEAAVISALVPGVGNSVVAPPIGDDVLGALTDEINSAVERIDFAGFDEPDTADDDEPDTDDEGAYG
jgi:hypothetical protein